MPSLQPDAAESGRTYLAAFFGVVAGLLCIYIFANTSQMWWKARSWQPVEAQLVSKPYVRKLSRDGKEYERLDFWYYYHYSVGGAKHIGSDLSLGYFPIVSERDEARIINNLQGAVKVTVWVDPRKPGQAVLERSFRWRSAMCWFVLGLLAFAASRHLLVSTRNAR
jgi:hypothetical protein